MSLDNKKIKLQKVNKYKMPVYDYPYTYKVMNSISDLKKAIDNIERSKIKPITRYEVLDKFDGIREANQEEIDNYISLKKGLSLYKWFYYLGAIFLLGLAFSTFKSSNIDNIFIKIGTFVFFLFMAIIIFSMGSEYDRISFEKRKIKKSKVYVAKCYKYDEKILSETVLFKAIKPSTPATNFTKKVKLKVKDKKNHYIDVWLNLISLLYYYGHYDDENILLYVFIYKDKIDLGLATITK